MPFRARAGVLVALLCSSIVLAACGAGSTTGPAATPGAGSTATVQAVATFSILADLVRNVGGERVAVETIVPVGADPHTFEPSPGTVQALARSQVVFANGIGFEEWLEETLQNAGGSRPVIELAEGLPVLEGEEHADEHADEYGGADQAGGTAPPAEEEHGHEGGDPHMWQDVTRVITYVERIRDGLIQVDGAGAETYRANAAQYIATLTALDAWVQEQVNQIPAEQRRLVTSHDTFAYFAERYGFEVVGTVFEGFSTEQEPSAQALAELVERIEAAGVRAIFTENTVNTRLADQVASEAGVQVVTQLYTDSLGAAGSPGATYEGMIRANVEAIVAALR